MLLLEGSDVDEVPLFDGTEDKCKTDGTLEVVLLSLSGCDVALPVL
ncbi:MAG: hypothetical protein WA220_04165 [Candidatus Nitrosopolaris sp.]